MKVKKVKSFFLTLLFFSVFLFSSVAKAGDDWFGIYTVDDLPSSLVASSGCRIVNMGGVISSYYMFIAPQYDKALDKCPDCYLNKLKEAVNSCVESLQRQAKLTGFNAIVGLKVVITSQFDGFQGSVINGKLGYGYAYVTVLGTPVVIKCPSSSEKK